MNTKLSFSFRWLWLATALFAAGGCATMNRPEVPGTLRVAVEMPPVPDLLVEQNVSDALVDRVREVFRAEGFNSPVEEARFADAAQAPQLLTLHLMDWRMTRSGQIECTFSAELRTPLGSHRFGVYNSTLPRWVGGPGRWGLLESFEQTAESALHQLYRDIARTDLLRSAQEPTERSMA